MFQKLISMPITSEYVFPIVLTDQIKWNLRFHDQLIWDHCTIAHNDNSSKILLMI